MEKAYPLASPLVLITEWKRGFKTHQILQLPRPKPVVFVERVFISHGLETRDFFFLVLDLFGCVVENGFHLFLSVLLQGNNLGRPYSGLRV